jgi:hypothetical protein
LPAASTSIVQCWRRAVWCGRNRSLDTQTPPTWATWREAVRVVTYRPNLTKTVRIALVVGTILFCINQLNFVLEGKANTALWIKVGVTYLVPFCVANAGILVATKRPTSNT